MLMIPGLSLLDDYVTATEAASLIGYIDGQPWLNPLKRRVQHYGYIYDYRRRSIDPAMHLGGLPPVFAALAQRLHAEGHFPAPPDQCIINEYEPGQGISPHVDCEPCFGDVIASLSLLSACVMQFTHLQNGRRINMPLPPCSLLIMRDEARYQWKHSIPARHSDVIDGEVRGRSRRVSVTFRQVVVREP